MQTFWVRAIVPGIAGSNYQYREGNVVFQIEVETREDLPAWVVEVEAP